MAKQSIESMYDLMFKMRDKMEELLQDAQELAAASKTYGGEIARVLTEQLAKYFAPSIKKLIDDEATPGAVIGLIRFMDSIPLAYTRVEPSMDDVAPVTPESPDFQLPASQVDAVENLPMNASFNTTPELVEAPEPQTSDIATTPETPYTEATKVVKEAVEVVKPTTYVVKRTSTVGSSLGEDVANLDGVVVASFDTEAAAMEYADKLNSNLASFEKDAFGFNYEVEECSGATCEKKE